MSMHHPSSLFNPVHDGSKPESITAVHVSPAVETQLTIASDGFVVGDIDFSDTAAVRHGLNQTTFGHLFTDAAVEAACRAGRARDLFPNVPPSADSFEVRALREWLEPCAKSIMEIVDLKDRALFIIAHSIHGSTKELCKAIESVAEAGIFGVLAQANLREPMQRIHKGYPWHRPRPRPTYSLVGQNLFAPGREG